ncbi:hypothetical protein JD793_004951 [Citrobacter braakii]|nr:hypothetical protein [Citrobacter braakii]
MKKTLIALTLATVTVSGSAMAWTSSGIGGTFEMGGTLTPLDKATPWEVMVGTNQTTLNADVSKGTTSVSIPVGTSIPVLGIRTKLKQAFTGMSGIAPQIDFKGAIDPTKFSNGVTTLTLDVKDSAGLKIGKLTVPFSSAAVFSQKGVANEYRNQDTGGGSAIQAYKGGLGVGGQLASDAPSLLDKLSPEFMANFNAQGFTYNPTSYFSSFSDTGTTYSSAYGSGINAGSQIKITFDNPVDDKTVSWKASLPVSVSYL